MDITEQEAVKQVREFKPIYLVAFVVPILLFFFLSIVLIFFLVSSYRDHLIKQSIDNYGYSPDVSAARTKESAILNNYGWSDEEKQLMHVPISLGGNDVIERYQKRNFSAPRNPAPQTSSGIQQSGQ